MADDFGNLFSGNGDESSEKITINTKFATKYHKFKECQELDRLKQKYGDVQENEESSSESEDEAAEALTPQIEEDFLKTISMIKAKDPKIYKSDIVFFEQESNKTDDKKDEKSKKPMYLKDYERERLLKKGTKAYLSDSDSENEDNFIETKNTDELTYNEEQQLLKKSFKSAIDGSDDSDDDLLELREKTSEETQKEEKEYKSWLQKEGKNLGTLGRYWKDDKLDDGEKFLRDYILKKQYVESERIPTYHEVVGDLDSNASEQEDDEEIDREEEFERKFNFRYEEPDQEFIKRYPRTVAESVRRQDEKRKEQRKTRTERKDKEKEQKKEELKRMKKLKRKEIMKKIEKLKEITGNEKVGFLEDDIEGDFDAKKYDELMSEVFDKDYYNEDDMEKPVFSDDDQDGQYYEENWDEWTGEQNEGDEDEYNEMHCEDPEFNMDADYVPDLNKKKKKTKEERNMMKNGKRMSKFAQAITKQKPLFNPDEKSFQEYFDEYYQLDYEDIIGDMPVRFKYRNVVSNDFGLSTEEVLKADDKELNEWCSLKKTIRYYTEDEEMKERQKYKKKARNKKKKMQVLQSLQEEEEEVNVPIENMDVNTTKIEKPRNINQMQKKKEKLRQLSAASKPKFKQKLQPTKFMSNINPRNHNKKLNTSGLRKNTPPQRLTKLEKQFRGGNTEHLKKLSANRLAAYGLDKRKKKEQQS